MSKKEENKALAEEMNLDPEQVKALRKKLSKIEPRSERGVETLFRLLSKNHYTLNTMVDRKSNILISINAIILSIIIGTVMNRMQSDPHLIMPIVMMLLTNMASITLAVFATRPDFKRGNTPDENPLFFGNFHDKGESAYLASLRTVMNSGDDLYDTISRDVYYLGKNINRKFIYLRNSFNVFMIGIILSVLTFIACHLFFGEGVFAG